MELQNRCLPWGGEGRGVPSCCHGLCLFGNDEPRCLRLEASFAFRVWNLFLRLIIQLNRLLHLWGREGFRGFLGVRGESLHMRGDDSGAWKGFFKKAVVTYWVFGTKNATKGRLQEKMTRSHEKFSPEEKTRFRLFFGTKKPLPPYVTCAVTRARSGKLPGVWMKRDTKPETGRFRELKEKNTTLLFNADLFLWHLLRVVYSSLLPSAHCSTAVLKSRGVFQNRNLLLSHVHLC